MSAIISSTSIASISIILMWQFTFFFFLSITPAEVMFHVSLPIRRSKFGHVLCKVLVHASLENWYFTCRSKFGDVNLVIFNTAARSTFVSIQFNLIFGLTDWIHLKQIGLVYPAIGTMWNQTSTVLKSQRTWQQCLFKFEIHKFNISL